ncbi:hypothetical protein I79_002211 [Cricetulus griseus]|uniref:Uncharacterized protein n=1 Tax=Cricetulus griseus TaxID=10029 RepID=G3GWT0_CRIGR|nr:hypothetical protein I79_002211 [Cricetulus griseus]
MPITLTFPGLRQENCHESEVSPNYIVWWDCLARWSLRKQNGKDGGALSSQRSLLSFSPDVPLPYSWFHLENTTLSSGIPSHSSGICLGFGGWGTSETRHSISTQCGVSC